MRAPEHLIWDWNGTLLDDTRLCLDIMNRQLCLRDLQQLSIDTYQRVFRFPLRSFYEKVGFDFSRESYEEVARGFIDEYGKRRFESRLHNGAKEVLERLLVEGFEHSLLSAYAEGALIEMLGHYGLRNLFSRVVGLDNNYAAGKMAEGKRLVEQLGRPASSVMMIGDTTHDHEVAAALGIECLLIANGHHARDTLETCGVPVLSTLAETGRFLATACA